MTERLTDKEIRALIEGSTPGKTYFGNEKQFNIITVDDKEHLLESTEAIWTVWQPRDGGDVYLAVTGDGPTSEGNAMLFANARALAEEVLELRARVAEQEALMEASMEYPRIAKANGHLWCRGMISVETFHTVVDVDPGGDAWILDDDGEVREARKGDLIAPWTEDLITVMCMELLKR